MHNNKKGQAALEFLMTYGWAILAAVVVIGVLWVLIGNPGNLAGDRYIMAAPFSAGSHQLTADTDGVTAGNQNAVVFEMVNGAGQTIDLDFGTVDGTPDAVTIQGCTDAAPAATFSGSSTVTAWAPGDTATFTLDCTEGFAAGSRLAGDIEVQYVVTGGSTLTQFASGQIAAEFR